MKSLQLKILFLVLMCLIVSCAIVGGVFSVFFTKANEKYTYKIMNLIASDKTKTLNKEFSHVESIVFGIASYTMNQFFDLRKASGRMPEIIKYAEQLEAFSINSAKQTPGIKAIHIRFNDKFPMTNAEAFWVREGKTNNFTRRVFPDFSNASINRKYSYLLDMETYAGEGVWSDPFVRNKTKFISFAVPLYAGGVCVAHVSVDYDFSFIADILEAGNVFRNDYAFLVNKSGYIMHHKRYTTDDDYAVATKYSMPGELFEAMQEREKSKDDNLIEYTWRGNLKKAVFSTLLNGMHIIVTVPVYEVNQDRDEAVGLVCVIVLSIIVIFSVVTVYLSKLVVRPLEKLNAAAQEIAKGNFDIELKKETSDEVGTLTESLKKALAFLHKYSGMAYRDSLTGLRNKASFDDEAERLDKEILLGKAEFAVLFIDLNGLKKTNDTYGHKAGDKLIIAASRIISSVFIHSPIFRLGGDEFVVILESGDLANWIDLMNKLDIIVLSQVQEHDDEPVVSFAKGIAFYESRDKTFGEVVKRADDLMYNDKVAMKALRDG